MKTTSKDDISESWHRILILMLKSGLSSNQVYACKKTDRILSEMNEHLLSNEEIEEWNDAVDEAEHIVIPPLYDDVDINNFTFPHNDDLEIIQESNRIVTRPEVFISYSWMNKDVADSIYQDLKDITGIILRKDNRDIRYKESMSKFMQSVRDSDYVIILISDSYLKSKNCMFEINNVMKNKNFKNKIFPILYDNIDIFSIEARLEFIQYWDSKIETLKRKLDSFNKIPGIESIINELKIYEEIRNNIDEFISVLCDMNLKTYEQIKSENYQDIIVNIISDDTEFFLEGAKIRSIENTSEQDLALEEFRTKFPNHKHPLYISGIIYEYRKDIDKAVYYFRKLIEKYPNFDFAYAELGIIIYDNLKDMDLAVEYYNKAISLNPNEKDFYYNLGSLYLQEKLFNRAVYYLKNVLEMDELDSQAHTNLAIAYMQKQNENKLAYAHFCKAIELNPYDLIALINLARLMWRHYYKYKDAIKIYEKVIEIEPEKLDAYLDLGELFISYDDYNLAIDWYKKALIIEADNSEATLALSILYKDQSEREPYLKMFQSKLNEEAFDKIVAEINNYYNE